MEIAFKDLKLTPDGLAGMLDHTLLKPFAGKEDFSKLCSDSMKYGFKMVAVNPAVLKMCKDFLLGSNVLAGAAIGFPLGQNTIETKVFETEDAIGKGSDEIDYVINIGELKNGNLAYVEYEMMQIVKVCRQSNIVSK